MREDFERYIQENPDDRGGYAVYADWLQEQGDPRGEFMAVQLELENESLAKAERDELKRREAELLAAHEREWLGDLAPYILDTEPIYRDVRRIEHHFTRGWLSDLSFRSLQVNETRALVRTPGANLLQRLTVEDVASEAPHGSPSRYADSFFEPGPDIPPDVDADDRPAILALALAPCLATVCMFRLGAGSGHVQADQADFGHCHTSGALVIPALTRMDRLRELYLYAHSVPFDTLFALPFHRLQTLRCDHCVSYPLEVLASNSTLTQLTQLSCHPHAQWPEHTTAYIRLEQLQAICRSLHLPRLTFLRLRLTDFGDQGAEELVSSGILKRLTELDLSYGCITDHGARLLADCPDIHHLSRLNLTMNAMTKDGIAALAATGIHLIADQQHNEHPDQLEDGDYLEYLCYGDME